MRISISALRKRARFFINRARERLWVRPFVAAVVSLVAVLVAKSADFTNLGDILPGVSGDSVDALLTIMAASMLTIAIFSVGAMVAAYASASSTASPRSFPLMISDDISQRALSTFVASFIFSIVGLVASKNGLYKAGGRMVLFAFTLIVFGLVIVVFLRWVDRIARLGRVGYTIEKVEEATAASMARYLKDPSQGGVPAVAPSSGIPVFADSVGYVQSIDAGVLQTLAEEVDGRIGVAVLPGGFVTPHTVLAHVSCDKGDADVSRANRAFRIGRERVLDDDPRYGLVILSQIADRALSPAVNDPGTAIDIIGILVRLLTSWAAPDQNDSRRELQYDRVDVPIVTARDLFDDSFTAITRDGSSAVEVAVRLQKAFAALATAADASIKEAAAHHSRRALAYAEKHLFLKEDVLAVRELATSTEVYRAGRGS